MRRTGLGWITGVLLLALSVALTACGGGGGGDGGGGGEAVLATYVFEEDNGMGGTWVTTVSVTNSTFSASGTDGVDSSTSSGTVQRLANGFIKITITASSDPTEIGNEIAGLEVPGMGLFVASTTSWNGTEGAYTDVQVGRAVGGSCASVASGQTYHYLTAIDPGGTPTPLFDVNTDGAYGSSSWSTGGSGLDFVPSDLEAVTGGAATSGATLTDMVCSGGSMTGTDGTNPIELFFTPSGIAWMGWDSGNATVSVMVPEDTFFVDNTPTAKGRWFKGMALRRVSPDGGTTYTMGGTFFFTGTNGTLDGYPYTDVVNNSWDENQGGIFNLDATTPLSGLLDLSTMSPNGGPVRFMGMQLPTGESVIVGIGALDFDASGGYLPEEWQIFVMVEQGTRVLDPGAPAGTRDTYLIPDNNMYVSVSDTEFHANNPVTGHSIWGTVSALGGNSSGFKQFTPTGATHPRERMQPFESFPAYENTDGTAGNGSMLAVFMEDGYSGVEQVQVGMKFLATACSTIGTYPSVLNFNIMTMPDESNQALDTTTGGSEEIYGTGTMDVPLVGGTYDLTPNADWALIANKAPATTQSALTSGACGDENSGPPAVYPPTITYGNTAIFPIANGLWFGDGDTTSDTNDDFLLVPQFTGLSDVVLGGGATASYRGWIERLKWVVDAQVLPDGGYWTHEASPMWAEPSTVTGHETGWLTAGGYGDGSGGTVGGIAGVLTGLRNTGESGEVDLNATGANGLFPDGAVVVVTDPGPPVVTKTMPMRYMVMQDGLTGKNIVIGTLYDSAVNTAPPPPPGEGRSNWERVILFEQ